MSKPRSTQDAVQAYLDRRQPDPAHAGADAVAAAAALRLAAVLDVVESGSGAANASRELRQQLELLRIMELEPGESIDDLRAKRTKRDSMRIFDQISAELQQAFDEQNDPPGSTNVQAF
jgi:hypothetical protein